MASNSLDQGELVVQWSATWTTEPKVRGSTLGLDEIFVRCSLVSPTLTESDKKEISPVCDA